MNTVTEKEIAKLQAGLSLIRSAGKWTTEAFGEMLGVTKQTISNLENLKTPMSKTQYIAIRAVLEYLMETEKAQDEVFCTTVNLILNPPDMTDEQIKTAQAFIEGATKAKLEKKAFKYGLAALIGTAAVEALIPVMMSPMPIRAAGLWLGRMIHDK